MLMFALYACHVSPAKWTARLLNIAIALQVILGAFTTGIAASGSKSVRLIVCDLCWSLSAGLGIWFEGWNGDRCVRWALDARCFVPRTHARLRGTGEISFALP